jgi:hypothetical protein
MATCGARRAVVAAAVLAAGSLAAGAWSWLPAAGGLPVAHAAPDAPRWVHHDLGSPNVSDVAVDAAGAVWLRLGGARRLPTDLVIGIGRNGRPQLRAALTEVVAGRFEIIRRQGSLVDYWAVDAGGRVWVGPTFFDGRAWTQLDRDSVSASGALLYDYRAAADAKGQAWAPWAVFPNCPSPEPCDQRGLRAFDAKGQQGDVAFAPLYEADAWGVADVHLLQAAGAAPTERLPLYAAARAAFYRLPSVEGENYPFLGPPLLPTQLRNAGYATAAARRPDGRVQVITWVELQKPEAVEYRILANTWTEGQGWDAPEDWTESPLVAGNARGVRLVVAAWSPVAVAADQATLWAASSAGGVARQVGGKWDLAFDAKEIGLTAGARIRDLAVGLDGTVWLATDQGVFTYGELGPIPPPVRAYLPAVVKWLGWFESRGAGAD